MDLSLSTLQRISKPSLVLWLLTASFFALPLSSSAKSICLSLAMLSLVLSFSKSDLITSFKQSYAKPALYFFILAIVASLWSPAFLSQKALVIEKYSKLLYLPILVLGFQNEKTRKYASLGFLFAMFVTSSLSILKYHHFLASFAIDPDRVFRNHIITGFMASFAAYLTLFFAYKEKHLYSRIAFILLFLLFSYHVLFINGGRAGYLMYLLAASFFLLQIFSLKQAFFGILFVCSLFALSYSQSPVMQMRISSINQELKAYKHNEKATSLGFRLQFHQFAKELFLRQPLIGNGTGSFTYLFAKEDPVPAWNHKLLEPHSQYWLVAAEFGLVGLIILAWFFIALFKACLNLKEMKPVALTMLGLFLIGNLSDSLLFYSGSGYFFILFMALCLSEKTTNKTH
ncbi:MAG: O-antigen ligase family protein [Proteobacteria bacterium]|nr:O-antigen ligase family protein [Pseudomonadota bacterium]